MRTLFKDKKVLFLCLFVIFIFLFLLFGYAYIYANISTSYNLDMSEIECLFSSEQDILSSYTLSLSTDNVYSDTSNILYLNKDRNLNENLDSKRSIESGIENNVELENNSEDFNYLGTLYSSGIDFSVGFSDNIVESTEMMLILGLEDLKIIECEEEYLVNNRLSSRIIDNEIGSYTETHDEKLYRLFGENYKEMDGRVDYYPNGEEDAVKDMKTFSVVVWDIDENGEWFKKNHRLTSHKRLVKTLQCIFNELLDLPEEDRVPIKIMGCYNYRAGSSAHTCGAAIDINWLENAEMTNEGVITAGGYWKPEEDIYSIKPDSPFVEIFEKYGWTWGGYWTSKKDYMHFSYIDR